MNSRNYVTEIAPAYFGLYIPACSEVVDHEFQAILLENSGICK
jgi:hypothetical protein